MTALGLHVPGRSVVHRAPAGAKLLVVVVVAAAIGSVFLDRPEQVGIALLVAASGCAVARIPVATVLRSLRPLLLLAGVLAVFHLVASGWERAVVVAGVLVLLVVLASLVTLTTTTQDLVDALVRACRPLRAVGVDPERVGLALALGMRSVPVVLGLAREVRDAQRARGLTASPLAFAVPLVVRSLRHAEQLGDALVARGADD